MGSGLWWQLRCKIYICGEAATFIPNFSFKQSFQTESRSGTPHGLTPKFERGNKWLGISDWGLGVTNDLNTIFGHPIYTPRRFHIFMRRTTTPNS